VSQALLPHVAEHRTGRQAESLSDLVGGHQARGHELGTPFAVIEAGTGETRSGSMREAHESAIGAEP
jgi:hypothetical protein